MEVRQGEIRLLAPDVIGKIAAGEVVERPAAAVKELVENSLDAGASAVTIEIRDGGISYIRIADNGCGIPQKDIRMAFERHATSKISTQEELFSIRTLGFRGEALASIASVSHMTCTTRTGDDISGIAVKNDGGRITSIEETACPQGTTMIVRDLFYNTPVRLKFLKKPATEAGYVSDLVIRLILSRPDVSFRYINQGRTVYHSAGDGRLDSAVFSIYGAEMTRSMRKVEGHEGGVVLNGYVGIGDAGRGNRGHQSFFVNDRYFRSALLSAAVEEACRERVMIGRFPTCVLHMTMPYETVDVNVHPNKLEVRFQNDQAVSEAVRSIVREAIRDRDALECPKAAVLAPEPAAPPVSVTKRDTVAPLTAPAPVPVKPISSPVAPAAARPSPAPSAPVPPENYRLHEPSAVSATYRESLRVPSSLPAQNAPAAVSPAQPAPGRPEPVPAVKAAPQGPAKAEQVASFVPAAEQKPMRIIGVVFRTFILVEYEENLLLIDQHAVHERILFDRFSEAFGRHAAGQELLIPSVLTVTEREQILLEENRETLEGMGLTVEPIGATEVAVRSLPMILGEPQAAGFVREVLDQLQGERGRVSEEKRRAALMQTACKHAVKGGETLSDEEIRELVSRMVDDRVTPTCPHGRPLVVALSRRELDRLFKRIQ